MRVEIYRIVAGYAVYTLLVANIINVVGYVSRLSLTSAIVFAAAFAVASVVMLLERRFTRGWPAANYYKLYLWVLAVAVIIAAASAFLYCPVICRFITCSCGVSTCTTRYFGVYAEGICNCWSC